MTAILVALGLVLTKVLVDGWVGRWDRAVDRWFFVHREATFDAITEWGSRLGDTAAIVGVAALAVVILAIARHRAHIAFLVAALVLEVTTFVTTTFVIDRERPTVPHLDEGPPTSSFPSGHVAASIVLYAGLALIITSLGLSRLVRVLAWIAAVAVPIFVAASRLYRGMHHPTDVIGSMIGALGCLAFAFLATRTGVAVSEENERTGGDASGPRTFDGDSPDGASAPAPTATRASDAEVSP
ncbi:MAG TPA: phosphatase PAP2 family protein [Actinomycetota bacterium]|nr:phosphatase PAP2 family protein [Actinomycetota bacterium]